MTQEEHAAELKSSLQMMPQFSERFLIQHVVGVGSFGTVFLAFDRTHNKQVALKALHRVAFSFLYRFKKEFRSLADTVHPNLVELYELFCMDERWFFTMEFVPGLSFGNYVAGFPCPEGLHAGVGIPTVEVSLEAAPAVSPLAFSEDRCCAGGAQPRHFDETRLRPALAQLARGVAALHKRGKLHCDLKPTNVLVNPDQRVIILDFGLISDIEGDAVLEVERLAAGTPAYMSPEQAARHPMSPASDWYAVGVILYEVLTGRRPFLGSISEMLTGKQRRDPPDVLELNREAPKDLADLAMHLLKRPPQERPKGEEILRRLADRTTQVKASLVPPPRRSSPLVGRATSLDALWNAYDRVAHGRSVSIHVRGASGFGKTALINHFLEQVRARHPEAVVLQGRCYEKESVPFKALDVLVDSLTHYLLRVSVGLLEDLLPSDATLLARMFPVLLRVGAITKAQRARDAVDPHQARTWAFAAFREILGRISRRFPLLVHIDDLQWADIDSALFFRDLFDSPTGTPLLFIGSFREDEDATGEILATVRGFVDCTTPRVETRDLILGPLDHAEAVELAMMLLGKSDDAARVIAQAVATEALGNPLFVTELVHYVTVNPQFARRSTVGRALRLDHLLKERIGALPQGARKVLRMIAVAEVPVPIAWITAALGADIDVIGSLPTLQTSNLVRTRSFNGRDLVHVYHDRVRTIVCGEMSTSALSKAHMSLAVALEKTGESDPLTLAEHFYGAGEVERAWIYSVLAAERATSAMAFSKAVHLYEQALALKPDRDTLELKRRLGDCLANAGSGDRAAQCYLEIAAAVSAEEGIKFRRRAAEELFHSGRIDEGLREIDCALRIAGMGLSTIRWMAVILLPFWLLIVKVRGLKIRPQDAARESSKDGMRADVCGTAATAVGMVHLLRGAEVGARWVVLALRSGDPKRVTRALVVQAAHMATRGVPARKFVNERLRMVDELAGQSSDPEPKAWAAAGRGISAVCFGRFAEAVGHLELAETLFRDHCAGAVWELANARYYLFVAYGYMGHIDTMAPRVRAHLREALDRGDIYSAAQLRINTLNLVWLADDDVATARKMVQDAMGSWSRKGFHLQHWWALVADTNIDLYDGKAIDAWKRLARTWPALKRSQMLRLEPVRVVAWGLRARCALGAVVGADPFDRAEYLRIARQAIAVLYREAAPWALALAGLFSAGLASHSGDKQTLYRRLLQASRECEDVHLDMWAVAARYYLGGSGRDNASERSVSAAEAWMASQGIKEPERWVSMLVPGLFR